MTRRSNFEIMSIVVNRTVLTGSFVPYHQAQRGAGNGLVGTFSKDALATGDSGSGTVTINLDMRREEFGFPAVIVPLTINTEDDLASLEVVRTTFISAGNPRLEADLAEVVTPVSSGGFQFAVKDNVAVPLEGLDRTQRTVLSALWATNADGKKYHLHMYGLVYDLQLIARNGFVDPLMSGLR